MMDQNTDPLLNQQVCSFENSNENLFDINSSYSGFSIKNPVNQYKQSNMCAIAERVVTSNCYIVVKYDGNSYKVMIWDSSDREVLGPFFVKSEELGHNATFSRQKVAGVQREALAPNVDTRMPKINGNQGLHLFLCPVSNCTEAHVKIAAAKLHALSHLNIKPYSCDYAGCRWSFYTLPKLKRHQETHLKIKDYQCTVEGCGKKFTTMYNYKDHKKKHDLPAVIKCPIETCDKKFQNFKARNDHVKTHDRSEASFVCPVKSCEKRFFSAVTLHTHSKTHSHNPEDVTCSICGKVFNLPCRLKDHLIKHTGEKPHPCNMCDKAFRSSSKLKRHIATHTNDRKYRCNICDKKFLRSESLKDHMDVHGQNLVQCKVCFLYNTKDEHIRHMKVAHPDNQAKPETITKPPEPNSPNGDVLLEQAIQSLGVPSDMMLSSYIEEPTLDFLDTESFSTVNLRDFGINV